MFCITLDLVGKNWAQDTVLFWGILYILLERVVKGEGLSKWEDSQMQLMYFVLLLMLNDRELSSVMLGTHCIVYFLETQTLFEGHMEEQLVFLFVVC